LFIEEVLKLVVAKDDTLKILHGDPAVIPIVISTCIICAPTMKQHQHPFHLQKKTVFMLVKREQEDFF
jgi:hypothetical protein